MNLVNRNNSQKEEKKQALSEHFNRLSDVGANALKQTVIPLRSEQSKKSLTDSRYMLYTSNLTRSVNNFTIIVKKLLTTPTQPCIIQP